MVNVGCWYKVKQAEHPPAQCPCMSCAATSPNSQPTVSCICWSKYFFFLKFEHCAPSLLMKHLDLLPNTLVTTIA